MCRLFGFRSVIQSMVHRSLVLAENALSKQSQMHPDGWGVCYYLAGVPHLIKSGSPAIGDSIFNRVSGVVASETVLAHIRQATTGSINTLNSHPFQYGKWVFAHNGQINVFTRHRQKLLTHVAPTLRRFILGDTDSELLFFLILSELSRRCDFHRPGTSFNDLLAAINVSKALVQAVCDGPQLYEKSLLTTIITDGLVMVGSRLGKPLLYSTYKKRCMDRDICPHLAKECEAPTTTGHVNHLILSSESVSGDNTWVRVEDGDVVGVDWRMKLHFGKLEVNIPAFPANGMNYKDIQLMRRQVESPSAQLPPLSSSSMPSPSILSNTSTPIVPAV